jgi:signal transduction histidine kinase
MWTYIEGSAVLILVETALILLLLRLASVRRRDIRDRTRNEEAIRELNGKLIHAQEAERSRIARELHDDINQQLTLLAIELQEVEASLQHEESPARARLKELRQRTYKTSRDVQLLSHKLHSTRLDYLGLSAAIQGLAHEFTRQQEIGLDLQCRDVPEALSKEVSLTLFRIAQEALQNIAKHSHARNVTLELMRENGGMLLRISDDGVGFEPSAAHRSGLGMISMQERVHLIGGRLSVRSRVGAGTQVEAYVAVPITLAQAV